MGGVKEWVRDWEPKREYRFMVHWGEEDGKKTPGIIVLYLFNDAPRSLVPHIAEEFERRFPDWFVVSPHRVVYVDATREEWEKVSRRRDKSSYLKQILGDFILGIRFRFPLCCVVQYCIEVFLNEVFGKRAQREEFRYTRWGDPYVPCLFHRGKPDVNQGKYQHVEL